MCEFCESSKNTFFHRTLFQLIAAGFTLSISASRGIALVNIYLNWWNLFYSPVP